MTIENAKRERIIDEIKRRLRVKWPAYKIDRGYPGMDPTKQLPAIWIFEGGETFEHVSAGKYILSLTVIVEYFKKVRTGPNSYEDGNEMLTDLWNAIEFDQRFAENDGADLVVSYGPTEREVILWEGGICDSTITFVFRYTENSPGVGSAGYFRRPGRNH